MAYQKNLNYLRQSNSSFSYLMRAQLCLFFEGEGAAIRLDPSVQPPRKHITYYNMLFYHV